MHRRRSLTKKGRILSNGLPDPTRPLPEGYIDRVTGTGSGRERYYPLTPSQESVQADVFANKARDERAKEGASKSSESADMDYIPD